MGKKGPCRYTETEELLVYSLLYHRYMEDICSVAQSFLLLTAPTVVLQTTPS